MFSSADAMVSPYLEMDRPQWRSLRAATPLPLSAEELDELRGLGDPISLDEVADIYLPLSRLLNFYVSTTQRRRDAVQEFLGERRSQTPFVVGMAGSVAVGKSTIARLLQILLARWPDHPNVELVTTDGFLLPNAILRERNLMHRKGFPESYDRRGLVRFIANVKAGTPEAHAPVYSHLTYDIVPGQWQAVRQPDILILEGLNVLQPGPAGRLAVTDFFDFSIYVDARIADIRQWYVERFFELRQTAFADPRSFFHRYATLSDGEATRQAEYIWHEINEVNLVSNIQPTRPRATLVLQKDASHAVQRVRLRKT